MSQQPTSLLLEQRATFEQELYPIPDGVSIESRELAPGLPGEWTIPRDAGKVLILHFHGGGYTKGGPVSHREMLAQVALASKAIVFSLDYRRAPEIPFPAAFDDGMAAYRAALRLVAPSQLVVMGDSAGGGMALSVLVHSRDAGLAMPAAAVLLSPWTDMTLTANSITALEKVDPTVTRVKLTHSSNFYLQGADPRDSRASALFADLHGLPPTLFQVGTVELLLDDSLYTAEKMLRVGARVRVETYPGARRPPWPQAEFIVGNPPFIGGKDLRARLGDAEVEALWAAHKHINKSADFVMYWWDRAAEILTQKGTVLRRFGLVTTNSITQEFSRRTIRKRMDGKIPVSIVFAIPDHPWTKAAADAAAVRIAMTVVVRGAEDGVLRDAVRESGLDTSFGRHHTYSPVTVTSAPRTLAITQPR